ncbi:MAG: hypothetical protein NC200_07055 [Candidatus Gastranaerophilales bacterium]|nr:hypothetical protein [Candidatus Gastranaerophilales bacterium]
MSNIAIKPFKLKRKDGQSVDVEFYSNTNIDTVEILDIKKLKFEGTAVKNIKKSDIHNAVLKGENKLYLQNKHSKIVAGLSKKHLSKIISTVFTKDTEGKYSYLKKEIVSNVDLIFYAAIPILKHAELKKQALYHNQIIHRFALPLKIGGLVFFAMITVKERLDCQEMKIDEFSIYDLYSETVENKKSSDSPSTVSKRTFRSHYQMTNYSIYDLYDFVKCSITKL